MHDLHDARMSARETRAAGGLALVYAFRMLGMFMVLPVLATYGQDLAGATPAWLSLPKFMVGERGRAKPAILRANRAAPATRKLRL